MRASYAPSETDLIHRAHEAFSELTHLYQTAPVGMYLMNRDLRYVRINELLFEQAVVKRKVGMVLASMEERARLIHGDLTIRAEPGKGTGIFVRAPLPQAMA